MLGTFRHTRVPTPDVTIDARVGGNGPPVLLLHGYPQTQAMWHRVAPALAEEFTVVLADLRGYGASDKPRGTPGNSEYSKRTMAADQVAVMRALGFESFAVVGHDRGGRVGHRLALDHRERVTRLAVLDILPTLEVFRTTDEATARAYFHWFFLSLPGDLPERMIGADPEYFLRWCLERFSGQPDVFDTDLFDPEALASYVAAFADPDAVHATCEDYRAGAGVDLEHDEADLDRPLACPLLALWAAHAFVATRGDVLGAWRRRALDVRGGPVPGGHYFPEQSPAETIAALMPFLLEDRAG
jgi:haloacetate dehalogenase